MHGWSYEDIGLHEWRLIVDLLRLDTYVTLTGEKRWVIANYLRKARYDIYLLPPIYCQAS